jgi:hypothetical protein
MIIACNGSFGNAPHALTIWLLATDYSGHCRDRIVAYAELEGTLAGCPELDREDEAVAEQVWCENLPAVPQTSKEWCDPMEWTLPHEVIEALYQAEIDADCPPDPWPTEAEIAEYEAEVEDDRWLHVLEATREFYRRHGSFGDWLESQGGPRP